MSTRVRRKFLTEDDLRVLIAGYEINGETEVVGTLRVGKGKDALRLISTDTIGSANALFGKMQQFCSVFPIPRSHGEFEITRDQLPNLYRHSREVRAQANALLSSTPRPIKELIARKEIPAGVVGDLMWIQICSIDLLNLRAALSRLIQTAAINKSVAVPSEALKWTKEYKFAQKNVAKWAKRAGVSAKVTVRSKKGVRYFWLTRTD